MKTFDEYQDLLESKKQNLFLQKDIDSSRLRYSHMTPEDKTKLIQTLSNKHNVTDGTIKVYLATGSKKRKEEIKKNTKAAWDNFLRHEYLDSAGYGSIGGNRVVDLESARNNYNTLESHWKFHNLGITPRESHYGLEHSPMDDESKEKFLDNLDALEKYNQEKQKKQEEAKINSENLSNKLTSVLGNHGIYHKDGFILNKDGEPSSTKISLDGRYARIENPSKEKLDVIFDRLKKKLGNDLHVSLNSFHFDKKHITLQLPLNVS